METITYEQAIIAAKHAAEHNQDCLLLAVAQGPGYAIGRQSGTFNREAIDTARPIYQGKWNGGTIVIAQGDICLCALSKTNRDLGQQIIQRCLEHLQAKGLDAYQDGNDLMLRDGSQTMKVGSYAYTQHPGQLVETVVHISIGMDKEHVDAVCAKHGKPVLYGLEHYGVTTQEMSDYIIELSLKGKQS